MKLLLSTVTSFSLFLSAMQINKKVSAFSNVANIEIDSAPIEQQMVDEMNEASNTSNFRSTDSTPMTTQSTRMGSSNNIGGY